MTRAPQCYAAFFAAAFAVTGCGDNGGDPNPPGSPDAGIEWGDVALPIPPGNPTAPVIHLGGGAADAPGGVGGDSGALVVRSRGGVSLDRSLPGPRDDAAPPDGGIELTSAMLASDVERPETLVVRGAVEAQGPDAVRTITSTGGDIFVEGTLRAADLGATRQGITLRAPNGTVFVTGEVTSAGETDGDAGGPISIEARDVVLSGTVDSRGGAASDRAGDGGDIEIAAELDVAIIGTIVLAGGWGEASGGAGGDVVLEPAGGDLRIAGPIDFGGGDSAGAAGDAGSFSAQVGPDAGGVILAAAVRGTGGSGRGGADADGGRGAHVYLETISLDGPILVEGNGRLIVDGGDAAGAGRGGAGGTIETRSRDGDFSLLGALHACGGEAPDPDGRGGEGGRVNVWTDTNADGIGGYLTVETSGVIDVSGGTGTVGGSARNNGTYGAALFPTEEEQIAVLLNSETIAGPPQDGAVSNEGMIIAVGAGRDGSGGDVLFHGRRPNGLEDPLPGTIVNEGDGDGDDGDFVSE